MVIKLDFKHIRLIRQENNNRTLCQSIKENDMNTFYENVNIKELDRTLIDLEMSLNEFLNKCCDDDKFCKLAVRKLSKCASRQGGSDEIEQIRACNLTTNKSGVNINKLSTTAYRPTKDGKILSGVDIKKLNIQKDQCLKSFDAKISGKLNGYVSAKVAYGSGGHQDNVFEEMDNIAEWWSKYKFNTKEILVILIDTDLKEKFRRIKDKYSNINNILVCNHIEFQTYIIYNYSSSK